MRKTCLILIMLLLAFSQAQAVRYGIKKQINIGGNAYPSYLCYSPASDRMYSGNTGLLNVTSMVCANDSSLGPVLGTGMPAKMIYDSFNDRVYYKSGNETFYAINCAVNILDTSWGGFQGGTLVEYNPDNNKIYLFGEFSMQTQIYSTTDYSYLGLISYYMGTMHYYSPTNSIFIPAVNSFDTLGVFSGNTNTLIKDINIPGLSFNSNMVMASNPAVNLLYISLPNFDQVAIVNTSTNSLVTSLTVSDNPNNFALCPITNKMFVACNGKNNYSLAVIDTSNKVDSVQVGDSISTVIYNPADSLIYIGCNSSGYVKLIDPRLSTPKVVDSLYLMFKPQFKDMSVDKGGDVYVAIYNSDNIFVIGQLPQRIWKTVASYNWSNYQSWNFSDDGGNTWDNDTIMYLPDFATDSLIVIDSFHTINIDVPLTVDQLVVNGTLEQNAMVTVNNGAGDDIIVKGIYTRLMGPLALNPGATMVFDQYSTYNHNMNGDAIPYAVWDTLSLLNISGVINTMPAGMNQAFGNITWDGQQQTVDVTLPGGPGFSARDIYIAYTGLNSVYLTSAAKPELTVNNLYIGNGTTILGNGGPRKVHVKGSFNIYDPGWFYLTDVLDPGIDTLFLYGDYYHLLSGIGGGGPDSTAIVFCGSDTQVYYDENEILTGYINFQVNPGAFLKIPESNNLGYGSQGDFNLMPGATLWVTNSEGIYPTGIDSGAVMVLGARNYSPGANYYYYYSEQSGTYYTGPGIPDTVNQLIIESYGDQVYLSKDVAVMDSLKLLANNLLMNGHRLSLFGPIYQISGNLQGDSLSSLVIMGGNPAPVTLPSWVRDLRLLNINRPAVVTMTDTMLIYNRLELVNGVFDNGSNKLSFLDGATIFRNANGGLAGAGLMVFVNQVNLEYGAGIITAGAEMPLNTLGLRSLALKGLNDTLIVNHDTLNIWNNLSVSGGIHFNGKMFSSYGQIDTVGPAGELIFTDTCQTTIFGTIDTSRLPAITGGSLTLDNSAGFIMRRNISCTGPVNLSTGGMTVGSNTLILGDSLFGTGLLIADSTSTLVFQGQPVAQAMPSTINNLSKLVWDRTSIMTIATPLTIHDTLKLVQGVVDNSATLNLRSGMTVFRNSGVLTMPTSHEGPSNVVYGTHNGGILNTGYELSSGGSDLNNLTIGWGASPADTVFLAGDAWVNGRLTLQEGTLKMDSCMLTLKDTIDIFLGQLLADSTSRIWILNCPYPFSLPNSIRFLDDLYLESPAGMTMAESLYIRTMYRQTAGHILNGQLQYGPTAILDYFTTGFDTTSNIEFPDVGGPQSLMVGKVLQLHASRTIPGTLTLSNAINTGTNTITMDTLGTVVTGSGYVEGNLAKLIPLSGDTIITYELGTWNTGPSSVEIEVFNNTVPAFITAGIKGVVHPLVNDSTACLRKFWSFSGAGLAADSSRITLQYQPADFNPPNFTEASDESTIIAGRYDNGAIPGWQFSGIVTRNILGTTDGGSIVLNHTGNFVDNPEFTLARDSVAISKLPDTTQPFISSTNPADGAVGVAINVPVSITFSEPIDTSTFSYTFVPNPGGLSVAWSADSTIATFAHNDLLTDTVYLVSITNAVDTAGNALGAGAVPNPWSFRTVSTPTIVSSSWTGGAYKLFSSPVKPTVNPAITNLGDDLGAYSDSTWQMFGYNPQANSFVSNPDIYNGYGYWLASANDATLDVQGIKQDNYSIVGLEAGWNLIGCPFLNPAPVQSIEVIDSLSQMRPYNDTTNNMYLNDSIIRQRMWNYADNSYDLVNNGTWDSLSAFDSTSQLQPWQGYAVYALQPCSLFMMTAFKSSAKGVSFVSLPKTDITWQVEFSAFNGSAADRGIRIGVSPQARDGYDRLDAEKPPIVSNIITAYIPHSGWNQGPCQAYQYDFRPQADYIEWPLVVQTSGTEKSAELTYSLSQILPNGYQLYLVDRRTGQATVIRNTGKIGFSGSQEFAVIYTNQGLEDLSFKPLSFDLNRTYPNPFTHSITVNYQLAAAGHVSLKVYNVAGQLVKTVVDETALPGYYSQAWNGCDNFGRKIASGVYIMRLVSGGQEKTRKLVKIK